jgi:signal peptidase I
MTPTYKDGQWTLMQRTRSLGEDWTPDRFDVIAVWSDKDEELLCKRVIGLPGETVELIEGRIFIDGTKLSDSFSKGNIVYLNFIDIETDTVIATDHVWVVGDHREESIFGHFPIKEIRGKIVLY